MLCSWIDLPGKIDISVATFADDTMVIAMHEDSKFG